MTANNKSRPSMLDLAGLSPETTLQSAVEAYAQAEALFNSIGDGAIATDEFGHITKVNRVALTILGYKEEQVIGKWFPRIIKAFHEDGSAIELIDRSISQAFLTGKPVTQKSLYQLSDKSLLPVSSTVSPLMLSGQPIGAIAIFRDVSQEYEIDRMKSDFISLASHQLRTPLSAIKTYSHMLLDGFMGELSSPQKKALKTIVTASNRMNELISTLLNVSRIESGNVIVSPKSVNLNHLAEEIARELNLALKSKQLTFIIKAPKKPAIIQADNLLTKEVLNNLVSNSIKYTPEGGQITLTITPRKKSVRISIEDNGMGIPKNAKEQIFTKFYRAQNVVRRETTGTGLGLYLVKGIIEALGGTIHFESEENKGTTFHVKLPLQYEQDTKTSVTGPKLEVS